MESTDEANSEVNIQVGSNRVHIAGSEEFIIDELPKILDWVSQADITEESVTAEESVNGEEEGNSDGRLDQTTLLPAPEEGKPEKATDGAISKIEEIAMSINADPEKLSDHFYTDDDGIGVQDPRHIDPTYALLGYGIIKKELTGDAYLDNTETKKKLIDHEMVDIDRWGPNFLHQLRRKGLIKDDPNTDRKRNKPFKITPKGFDEFINWLENEESS